MSLFALQNKLFTEMFLFWVDIKKKPTHALKASGRCLAKGITVFICIVQSRPSSWKAICLDSIYSPVFSLTHFLWRTVSDVIMIYVATNNFSRLDLLGRGVPSVYEIFLFYAERLTNKRKEKSVEIQGIKLFLKEPKVQMWEQV